MNCITRLPQMAAVVLLAFCCGAHAAGRGGGGAGAKFDPSVIRMKVDAIKVNAAKVGAQCTGNIVVQNTGPGYADSATEVLPYWMLSIADAQGKEIFRAGGAWSGPLKTGETRSLPFDTHSNTLPGAAGKAFVFSAAGKFQVTVSVIPGGNLTKPIDSKTVTIDVAAK